MDSLSPVSPSIIFRPFLCRRRSMQSVFTSRRCGFREVVCRSSVTGDEGEDEVERAMRLDGTIPGSSKEFVDRVSSRAYHMRRDLHHTFDTSSYDDASLATSVAYEWLPLRVC